LIDMEERQQYRLNDDLARLTILQITHPSLGSCLLSVSIRHK
jgi:hypothetical protein